MHEIMKKNITKLLVLTALFTVYGGQPISASNNIESLTLNRIDSKKTTISGTVLDFDGLPLIGASVVCQHARSIGTITDIDGNFTLTVDEGTVLEVSYTGYLTKEVKVKNKNENLIIKLDEDTKVLEEVVVVGYGTQKKVNLTGSVTAIEQKELAAKPVGQLSASLQGMAPGVTITTNSGQPGLDQGTIRIRGVGTLDSGKDPLVLVDGLESDINSVDANDIATISILKDAAASSIYGVKAANGVILITTHRGESGKAKISYSNYFGWQDAARLAKYVGAKDFMQLSNQMGENSNRGKNSFYTQDRIEQYNNPNRDLDRNPDNYWLKDILTGSGFQQEHSLSIKGGSETVKYAVSTNYLQQDGLIKKMDYDRLTVRLNTDIKITDKLDLNLDISGLFSDRSTPQSRDTNAAWGQFDSAYRTNPLYPIRYSDGTWPTVRGENNIIRLQEEGGTFSYKSNLYTGNFKANYEIIEGLKLTGALAFRMRDDFNSMHTRAFDYYTNFPENTEETTLGQNSIKKESQKHFYGNYQFFINYDKSFNLHNLNLLAGTSYIRENNDFLSGYRSGLPNGTLSEINAGSKNGQETTGNANQYGLLSYFARVNYDFAGKYLFEANMRLDGSSQFKKSQRWSVFPSFSAGWRISEEAFMEDVDWVDNLKLRLSWGVLGNDRIGLYPYQSTYSLGSYPFGGALNQTAGLSTYANSDLTWETTSMADIGLDFTTLNNKLNLTFDYYIKTTNDVLMRLPIPSSVGLNAPYQNAGKIENKGWEFAISYRDMIGSDFNYTVGFNISDVRNKVLDIKGTDRLSADNNNIVTGLIVGKPIGSFYGYNALGFYQTQEDLDKYPGVSSDVGLGDIIYEKRTDSDSFSFDDMVYLGSSIPRYTYGININASYKGFDFTSFWQGVAKNDINTLTIRKAPENTDGNFRHEHKDSWTPDNTNAHFPRLYMGTQNYQSSSYWVNNAAYIRLKNLQLGYTLPKSILAKTPFTRVRMYVSGSNLLTFSKLPSDIDPESPGDSRYYPQVKTFTFGFNFDF